MNLMKKRVYLEVDHSDIVKLQTKGVGKNGYRAVLEPLFQHPKSDQIRFSQKNECVHMRRKRTFTKGVKPAILKSQ